MRIICFCAILALGACSDQMANTGGSGGSLGVGVSTLGVTVEPAMRLSEEVGVRLVAASGSIDANETIDGITYDGTLNLGGVGVMADYYPGGGPLRLSGGVVKHNLELAARATGNIEVGSNTYAGVDLTSTVDTENDIAPIIAVGLEQPLTPNFSLTADLGAIFVGDFTASVTDATNTVPTSDLNAEIASIEDELNGNTILPYFKIGGAYRW